MVSKRGLQALLSLQAQECLLLLSQWRAAASVLLELSSCLSGRKLSDLAQSSSEAAIYNWAHRRPQYQSARKYFIVILCHTGPSFLVITINIFEFATSAKYFPV